MGIGAGYNGGTIPNLCVTATFATRIANSTPALWSYTSTDWTSARTHPYSVKSSARTGMALTLHDWTHFTILEFFNAGASGGSNGGILPSLGVGGMVLLKLPANWTLGIDVHDGIALGSGGGQALQAVFEVGHTF